MNASNKLLFVCVLKCLLCVLSCGVISLIALIKNICACVVLPLVVRRRVYINLCVVSSSLCMPPLAAIGLEEGKFVVSSLLCCLSRPLALRNGKAAMLSRLSQPLALRNFFFCCKQLVVLPLVAVGLEEWESGYVEPPLAAIGLEEFDGERQICAASRGHWP